MEVVASFLGLMAFCVAIAAFWLLWAIFKPRPKGRPLTAKQRQIRRIQDYSEYPEDD